MSAHIHNLPHELAELVFAPLASDTPTMASCTLVCRAWAALCSPLRFRSVTICADGRRSNSNDGSLPCSFEDVLAFLRASPRLCGSVRALKLQSAGARSVLDGAVLGAVVEVLPALTSLQVSRLTLALHACVPPGGNRRLKQLTIGADVLCESQDALAGVLSLFGAIDCVAHDVTPCAVAMTRSTRSTTHTRTYDVKVKTLSLTLHNASANKVQDTLGVYTRLLDPAALTSVDLEPTDASTHELTRVRHFLEQWDLQNLRVGVLRCPSRVDLLPRAAGATSVQYAVALEYSPWLGCAVTCGWDAALRGLVCAPASACAMGLTFVPSSSLVCAKLGPVEGVCKLWTQLEWEVLEEIVKGREGLESLRVEVAVAQFVERDERRKMEEECARVMLSRCRRAASVEGVLRVVLV